MDSMPPQEYLPRLASKLIAEVQQRFREEYKASLAEMVAAGISTDALDQMIKGIGSHLALDNFDQYCPSDLSIRDRERLKSYLQAEAKLLEIETNQHADLKRLFEKIGPREIFEQGLWAQVINLATAKNN
jgi:hypothetical protein